MKTKNLKKNRKILMMGSALVSVGAINIAPLDAATGTLSAAATITTAITVSVTSNILFGKFAQTTTTATGQAVIDTAGNVTATGKLVELGGKQTAGQIKVTGATATNIDVKILGGPTFNLTGPGQTIVLDQIDIAGAGASATKVVNMTGGATQTTLNIGGRITAPALLLSTGTFKNTAIKVSATYQ